MPYCRRHVALVIAAIVPLLLISGCGGGNQLATVQGTITKDGEPQPGLWIRFSPTEGGRPGNGRTDSNGRYEIRYSANQKGAHIGSNKVVIGSGGEIDDRGNTLSMPSEILTREVEVTSGSNTIDFELNE